MDEYISSMIFDLTWNAILQLQPVVSLDDGFQLNLNQQAHGVSIATERVHLFTVAGSLLMVSSENQLLFFHMGNSYELVQTYTADSSIRTLKACQISKRLIVVLIVSNLGKPHLIVVAGEIVIPVKSFDLSEEFSTSHALDGKLVTGIPFFTLVIHDTMMRETYIEVFRLPVEQWMEETQVLLQPYPALLQSPTETMQMSPEEETPSSTQGSYSLPQLSQPQLHCRVKVVPKTVPSTFKSLSAALRQVVDKQTTLFPVKSTLDGLHLFTAEILEFRRREFVTQRGYPECLFDQPEGDNSFSSQNVNGTPDATRTSVTKQLSSEQVPQKEHMVNTTGKNLNMSGKEKWGTIAGTEYVGNNYDSLTRSTSPTTKRLEEEAERSNVGIGVTANKELDEKIDALLEAAKNNAHTGYPRYEFIPVFEKDATDAKPIGKTKTNLGCTFQLGAYWSGSACLSFFSMDKINKNSEAIPEDWRIFSAPISCLRVCKIPSNKNSPFILQHTDDHASLKSAGSLYLLVGLINGNLIVRDLYSRLYLHTVNVCSGLIIEVNVLNPCEPSSKNLDISLIHMSVSRRSPPEVLFLRLSPDRTDVLRFCFLACRTIETYHAVAMLHLDGCLSLTAGLRSDSELVLLLPTGHSQKPKVDQLRYIRIQLPRPYVISLSCGTVSLLPRSQFDSIGEELSNQLRLTAAENGKEIYLWIRGVSRNVTEEVGAQSEKLFRVTIYPFPWKDAETENAGVAADESGELSETWATKRMKSASLMDWAETILRQRSVTRDRRRDEFVKLWQALLTRVEKLVVE